MKKILFVGLILFLLLCLAFNIALAQDKLLINGLPNKIIAGILDLRYEKSAEKVGIKQVYKDGYNLLIIGYASVKDNKVGFYDPKRDTLNISPHILKLKIDAAKEQKMKTLISFDSIQGNYTNSDQLKDVAKQIVNFIKLNKANGIVFSLTKYIKPKFLLEVTQEIRKLNSNIVIAINPVVRDGLLVTSAKNNDYAEIIESGDVNYILIKEYGYQQQFDPNYISSNYTTIVKDNKIPQSTKILIEEPTTSLIGGAKTIYHPEGNATYSITTAAAVAKLLPEINKLKYRSRFSGIVGNSLNLDYAPDLYGLYDHVKGSFAAELKSCIYNGECVSNSYSSLVVGGVLSFLDSDMYDSNKATKKNAQSRSSLSMLIPEYTDYCEDHPGICKYNMVFISYFKDLTREGFTFNFNDDFDAKDIIFDKNSIKKFVEYMRHNGKHVILSMGDRHSRIDWSELDVTKLAEFINFYGFDGINFDLDNKNIPKNQGDINTAASKIKKLVKELRSKDKNFILAFSPEWQYIVSPIHKDSMENIYEDDSYVFLINAVGLENITYIFLDTYSLRSPYSFFSYEKNGKKHKEITPLGDYVKFISSLAWALTTEQGYIANKDKYIGDEEIVLPSSKLVFLVDSDKLRASYVSSIIDKVEENKGSFNGFLLADFDNDARTKLNYESSKDIIDAIYAAEFPSFVHYSKPRKMSSGSKTAVRWANNDKIMTSILIIQIC